MLQCYATYMLYMLYMVFGQLARSSGSRSFGMARVLFFSFFFFKCGSQLPRRMMMMAELVQGQASVAQPGTKDDFADTIRRVRQVKCSRANPGVALSDHELRVCMWSRAGLWSGHPGPPTTNTPHAPSKLAS